MQSLPNEDQAWTDGNAEAEWTPVVLFLPRVALVVSRSGTAQQLLLPGRYERRHSRRFNRTIYRQPRPR